MMLRQLKVSRHSYTGLWQIFLEAEQSHATKRLRLLGARKPFATRMNFKRMWMLNKVGHQTTESSDKQDKLKMDIPVDV
jgi:hypothetical protein